MRKIKWSSDFFKKMLYPFAQTVVLTCFMDWISLLFIVLLSRRRKKGRNRTGKYISSGHLKQKTSICILSPPAHLLSWAVRNLQALEDSLRFQPFENTPQFPSTSVSFDSCVCISSCSFQTLLTFAAALSFVCLGPFFKSCYPLNQVPSAVCLPKILPSFVKY